MMANNALSVANPRMLGRNHPQVALSRQMSLHVNYLPSSDKVLPSTIVHARKKNEEETPRSYDEILQQREQQLWDRQSQMMDSAAKEARTNYETLLRAHAQLQSQLLAERELWAQQEDALRKENAELRSQILYTAAKLASLGPQISSNVRRKPVDSDIVDGRAAAGELPSPAFSQPSSHPSSSASSAAGVATSDNQNTAPPSFRSASPPTAEQQEVSSWAAEIEAAMQAVDKIDILTQDIDFAAFARNKEQHTTENSASNGATTSALQQECASPTTTPTTTSSNSVEVDKEDQVDATGASPTGPPPALSVGSDDIFWVSQLHTALVDAGFYPGDDEIEVFFFGESTVSALMTFQACEGLSETGAADEDTWKALLGPEMKLKPSRDLTADQLSPNFPGVTTPSTTENQNLSKKPFAELFAASSEQTIIVGSDGEIESETNRTTVSETDLYQDGKVVQDSITTTVTHKEEKQSVKPGARSTTRWPSLIDGDGGREVHTLHVLLDEAGFCAGEDDVRWWQYGDSTVNAVKTFQACSGLPESGAACARTWQALMPPGSTPADIYTIQSGHSDDEDLADAGDGTRVWLLGEQREYASSRSVVVAGAEAAQPHRHRPSRRQFVDFLWRYSAGIVLASPLTSAAGFSSGAALEALASGPPPPSGPGNGGGYNGGWGGNSGGSTGGSSQQYIPNELAQVAAAAKPITLTLASFAVTRKAYGKIVRKFGRDYEEATGRPVKFRLAFGGSGTQARAVIDGLPADIVSLALPLDVFKIEEAGLIQPGWEGKFPNRSAVCESVVSIVTRRGNPKNITGWEDLARDDIEVVVANPKTAGVARWIFLALWGHKMSKGETAAKQFVTKVFDNVEIMPRDAREASDVFYTQGFGDALLTYENEAVFTNLVVSPKAPLPYISPNNNVRITCPAALVDRNIDTSPPEVRDAAEAFINYLFTPTAQKEFVACGFRTTNKIAAADGEAPKVKYVWEVEKRLGNWVVVQKKFFDEGGILTEIMNDVSKRKLEQRLADRAAKRR